MFYIKATFWRSYSEIIPSLHCHRRPLGKAKAETLGDTSGDVKTRILVKTLALKLEGLVEALVDTLPHTPGDAKAATLPDTKSSV